MEKLILKHLLKNRTIVSKDSTNFAVDLANKYDCDIHEFKTNDDFSTWEIPLEWNVNKAKLSKDGKTILDYKDYPLFLAPYSRSFKGTISKDELLNHTLINPKLPDCFSYEFRLAYDYNRRLNDWRITMPFKQYESLEKGQYDIDIDIETNPLTINSYLKNYNFNLLESNFYHFHAVPPLISEKIKNLKKINHNLELTMSTDWRANFMCPMYLVTAQKNN